MYDFCEGDIVVLNFDDPDMWTRKYIKNGATRTTLFEVTELTTVNMSVARIRCLEEKIGGVLGTLWVSKSGILPSANPDSFMNP